MGTEEKEEEEDGEDMEDEKDPMAEDFSNIKVPLSYSVVDPIWIRIQVYEINF